ncbi:MAG TPA: hypothetical protein VKR59_02410 [Terriglobales bacterium]|nr:hypothetical protein [Terriglobales bacterium]
MLHQLTDNPVHFECLSRMLRFQDMWPWRRKKPIPEGFPEGFSVQRIGISSAIAVSELPAGDISHYFREHPDIAGALLGESYDKRYTPSTFFEEKGNRFRVGWFTRNATYLCVQEFSTLADAATDYLLFSLGKGRWTPQE